MKYVRLAGLLSLGLFTSATLAIADTDRGQYEGTKPGHDLPAPVQTPDPWADYPNASHASQVSHAPNITTIHDFLLAKVMYSNFVTLRPGSIYELRVHFEENAGFPRPTFNYLFNDTGLGAAEPLYAVFESGFQAGYAQLLQSASSDRHRHIDHFSDMMTPEGCRVQSVYIIRGIDDYPDLYKEERAQGYTLVDISWDYTTRVIPGAQCGRHRAYDPDPSFDPAKILKPYLKHFKSMDEIPPEILAKFEAKINLEKTLTEEMSDIFTPKHWTTYAEQYSLKGNSLWYYPDGHDEDYGVNTPRPQKDLRTLNLPRHFVLPATPAMHQALPLGSVITAEEFGQYADYMQGRPTADYDPSKEPGADAFSLSQITTQNVLTAGREMIPITDPIAVQNTVLNPANYRLVSAIVRPYEGEIDFHHPGGITLPEMRLVYQLVDPTDSERAYDQVFMHLTYNAVDRLADPATRQAQGKAFLEKLDLLTEIRENHPEQADAATIAFLQETIAARPVYTMAFSSSLTGIWIFGQLTRGNNADGALIADRMNRHGIDVGYFSTAYDNQLFRDAAASSKGARKAELQGVLEALAPTVYRDPRRQDTSKIAFNNVTCAQCHQMSGRDGIHVRLNDGLDSRIKTTELSTEYLYRELDRQLKAGAQ